MRFVQLCVMGYVFWLGAGSLVKFVDQGAWFEAHCDVSACYRKGLFSFERYGEPERRERLAQEFREKNFRIVCPMWEQTSYLGRMTGYRDLSWCADYSDRLKS